jgi:hypothetical protein
LNIHAPPFSRRRSGGDIAISTGHPKAVIPQPPYHLQLLVTFGGTEWVDVNVGIIT